MVPTYIVIYSFMKWFICSVILDTTFAFPLNASMPHVIIRDIFANNVNLDEMIYWNPLCWTLRIRIIDISTFLFARLKIVVWKLIWFDRGKQAKNISDSHDGKVQ